MKKKGIAILLIVVAVFALYFVGSGFTKNYSAAIGDYTISDDGTEITMHIDVMSSAGYIRKAAVHQQHGGKLYIDFYAAFGGINGNIGAKDSFTLPLNEDTTIIAIGRNSNVYEEILRKDTDGIWQRVK